MKMTENARFRCNSLVKDFAKRNGLHVDIDHQLGGGITKLRFETSNHIMYKDYWLRWDEMDSLSEGCTRIFVDLTRAWNLDGITGNGFEIQNVIFNYPATIVLWEDGTKTVVKCQEGDVYSKETGLALCIAKKALGNMPNFNNVFKKWIPEEETDIPVCHELRNVGINADDIRECYKEASKAFDNAIEKLRKGLRR